MIPIAIGFNSVIPGETTSFKFANTKVTYRAHAFRCMMIVPVR